MIPSLLLSTLILPLVSAAPSGPQPCSNILKPSIPGATILSLTSTTRTNASASTITRLQVCDVHITLTHPGANDTVNVNIWLPLPSNPTPWNNRFLATGGAGYSIGALSYGP